MIKFILFSFFSEELFEEKKAHKVSALSLVGLKLGKSIQNQAKKFQGNYKGTDRVIRINVGTCFS